MEACQNCGEKIEISTEVCPHCGSYLYDNEAVTDPEAALQSGAVEEEIFDGPINYNEAVENLPDETYSDDEVERIELEEERRKFGKSTE